MMSIALHDHQRGLVFRIPVSDNYIIRYDSVNREIAFSSLISTELIHSSVQPSISLLHCPCLTWTNVSKCDQLFMLPISLVSFPALQTNRHHSVHVSGPSRLNKTTFVASCVSSMIRSTSYRSEPSRSFQLFIKSIRNNTISIHIDPTSSISGLKHLIYVHDGIPPCDLRLLLRGRELRDDALLSGLDMDGATMTCLLRVQGGNPRTHKLPLRWWFGFSRSYEDGRAGEEGRTCHVLSEIEFECDCPVNWYSDRPLSSWGGVELYSGIVLIDCLDIFS